METKKKKKHFGFIYRFRARLNSEFFSFIGMILSIIALAGNEVTNYIPMYEPVYGTPMSQSTELSIAYLSFVSGFVLLAVICVYLFFFNDKQNTK